MHVTVPTSLTLFRIVLIPVLGLAFFLPEPWMNYTTATVFALAAITDWLDGFLARRLQQTSAFGAFLDPVADKLMVAVALIALVSIHPGPWIAIPAAVIVGREIAVSALRQWMSEIGEHAHVAVNWTGKVKTAAQMVALFLLLLSQPVYGVPLFAVGLALVWVAAGLTLYSMVVYLRAAWDELGSASR